MSKTVFSSESVTEGHPDKICDQISDSILDAALSKDPHSRVAAECLVKGNYLVIAGEVTTNANLDYEKIARQTIKEIGYEPKDGFSDSCEINVKLTQQSPDISMGVSKEDQGAGDQGMMFGYATKETPELMPLPITLAHALTKKLAEARKKGLLNYLRPDGKSQVSIVYEHGKPIRAETIVVSSHHEESVAQEKIREDIIEQVIKPVCGEWMTNETKFYVNPTGRFVVGGPVADSGLTGRKIIVDSYGGSAPHGGGAYSGKDSSKVDRSAAYMARYVAKNVVASDLADKIELQIAYAIGVAQPVSVHLNCFGTNKIRQEQIRELILKNFDLRPKAIVQQLDLLKPVFKATASYGHFGRKEFSWEQTDKVSGL